MTKPLRQIVSELRASGELDEEALGRLEKHRRKMIYITCGIPAFILITPLIKGNILGLLLAGGISYYFIALVLMPSLKEWDVLTYLISFGQRGKATVRDVTSRPGIGYSRVTEIACVTEINSRELSSKVIVSPKFLREKNYPKDGDEIDIFYNPENPALFRFFNKKMEEFFCISKRKVGEN